MSNVVITGIPAVKHQFAAIEAFLASTKPMEGIVTDIKDIILTKTSNGVDYMGKSFAPYSETYAKRRKGRTAKGRPNLKRTGTMLHNIYTKVDDSRHGRIDIFPGAEPGGKGINSKFLAQVHTLGTTHAGKNNDITIPQREFMNLAPSAVKKLTKKHYDDPILVLAKAARGR